MCLGVEGIPHFRKSTASQCIRHGAWELAKITSTRPIFQRPGGTTDEHAWAYFCRTYTRGRLRADAPAFTGSAWKARLVVLFNGPLWQDEITLSVERPNIKGSSRRKQQMFLSGHQRRSLVLKDRSYHSNAGFSSVRTISPCKRLRASMTSQRRRLSRNN